MTAKSLMFMGTGSDVGKSLIVAGLARLLANRGISVAPFKPQNMSNNAAVTGDGGEIGRAQALQARAAKVISTIHMNPLLLKPESQTGAQVILQGKRAATMQAREFFSNRQQFLPAIVDSFERVKKAHDIVLVEGAGSPAEVNLRVGDLANMGFARAANVPAVLIGDIHRGGVIASISGTFDLLEPEDRALLKAFIINRFHGDVTLFDEGRRLLEKRTKTPCLGIVGHFAGANRLPAEDAVTLQELTITHSNKKLICVLKLPRIANFDDIDALRMEPEASVRFVDVSEPIPGDAALVIIPGSKSTIADLAAVRGAGWDIDLKAHVRRGGRVLGLCGGYQMLGRAIHDPGGVEGQIESVAALGLLDVETTLLADKTLRQTQGKHIASGKPISGYEIHLGQTRGNDCERPFAALSGGDDGACSADRLVQGTYIHGCFAGDEFRQAYLAGLGIDGSAIRYEAQIEQTLDALAEHLAACIDIDRLLQLAE